MDFRRGAGIMAYRASGPVAPFRARDGCRGSALLLVVWRSRGCLSKGVQAGEDAGFPVD